MTLRDRLIGPCAQQAADVANISVDLDAFVQRLLLFDTYVLQSAHMLEVPALASLFGIGGLVTLLKAGALRVQCDAVAMGQTGQTTFGAHREANGPLPLGSFSLSIIRAHDQESVVTGGLANVQKTPGALKDVIRLKQAIVEALEQPPAGFGVEALKAMPSDLQNTSLVRTAIVRGVSEALGRQVDAEQVEARVVQINNDDFRIESNLQKLLALSDVDAHNSLERAALAIGDVNYRLEQMKAHRALSGLIEDDLSFFEHKLGIVAQELDAKTQEHQFTRAVTLRGFPSIDPGATRIDVEKVLKARESSECREFRHWLRTLSSASDVEVRDRTAGITARLGTFLQSPTGKTVRFLATTGLGVAGTVPGLVAGIIDAFVVDQLFSVSGPALFINRTYPSVFRHR